MPTWIRTAVAAAGLTLLAPGVADATTSTGGAVPPSGGVAAFSDVTATEAHAAAATPRPQPRPARAQLRPETRALLERIAKCESGGDPTIVSPDGRYRGKYQFAVATWRAMGGKGDPAAAPEAEQDRRAAKLLRVQGPSAWPVCARGLAA